MTFAGKPNKSKNRHSYFKRSAHSASPSLEDWRAGGLEAWKFGGLEAWKDSAVWSVEIRPQGFQNGTPGPPKWSSWTSKMEPRAPKMGPAASKMAPSWPRIDQDGDLEVLRHPKGAKINVTRTISDPNWEPRGPKSLKMVPEWGQNGI